MGLVPGFGSCGQGEKIHRPLHSGIQIDGMNGRCKAVGDWAGPQVELGEVADWDVVIRFGPHGLDPANLQAKFAGVDPVALVLEELDALDLVGILVWDPVALVLEAGIWLVFWYGILWPSC